MESEKGIEKTKTDKPKENGRVLRAEDIIPRRDTASNQKLHSAQKASAKTVAPQLAQKAPKGDDGTSGNSVPAFDLAEEIMAEQRKISAAKRKGPGTKNQEAEKSVQLAEQNKPYPIPKHLYSDNIIAEIVARDIKKFCKSDYPNFSPPNT
jgi:hypothetical protein